MLFYSGIENRQRNYLNCLFSGLAIKSQRLEIFNIYMYLLTFFKLLQAYLNILEEEEVARGSSG